MRRLRRLSRRRFAGLPECRFCIPAPDSHRSVVSLTLRKRGHRKIISHSAGHSVVTGVRATKKAGTQMCTDLTVKGQTYPFVVLVSHSCNRLWNSKSKLSFTLSARRQFKADVESDGISFSHTAGVYGVKPSSKILWRYVVGCSSPERVFYYTRQNICLSILSDKFLNIFLGRWEYYLVWLLKER